MARHAKDIIDRETDARFWAQTHYRPGQRLDPADSTDRKMMKVWLDIWGKVKREDRAGELVLTYNHPEVEQGLSDAELASHAADTHVEAASAAPDPGTSRAHAAAASEAASAASASAKRAAARQPPTVSPALAEAAAEEVARDAGISRPSAIAHLPDDHPAIASPAAQPIMTTTDAPLRPIGPVDPNPISTPPPMPSPPSTPRQHLAHARAANAPSIAVAVHEDAHARGPATMGALHPRAVADIRDMARRFASDSMGSFVGVAYSPDEQWSVPLFTSAAQAASWYEQVTDAPDAFRYVAFFDKTAPSWPSPIQELFGSSRTLGAAAQTGADAGAWRKKTPYVAIAAGGAVLVGLAAVLATSHRKARGGSGTGGKTTKMRSPGGSPGVQIFELGGGPSMSSKR